MPRPALTYLWLTLTLGLAASRVHAAGGSKDPCEGSPAIELSHRAEFLREARRFFGPDVATQSSGYIARLCQLGSPWEDSPYTLLLPAADGDGARLVFSFAVPAPEPVRARATVQVMGTDEQLPVQRLGEEEGAGSYGVEGDLRLTLDISVGRQRARREQRLAHGEVSWLDDGEAPRGTFLGFQLRGSERGELENWNELREGAMEALLRALEQRDATVSFQAIASLLKRAGTLRADEAKRLGRVLEAGTLPADAQQALAATIGWMPARPGVSSTLTVRLARTHLAKQGPRLFVAGHEVALPKGWEEGTDISLTVPASGFVMMREAWGPTDSREYFLALGKPLTLVLAPDWGAQIRDAPPGPRCLRLRPAPRGSGWYEHASDTPIARTVLPAECPGPAYLGSLCELSAGPSDLEARALLRFLPTLPGLYTFELRGGAIVGSFDPTYGGTGVPPPGCP